MAGTILRTPALGSADWSTWITQQERTDRGFLQVSLTNFAATTASTVATGSVMECAGSIYQFTDTAITLATGAASAEVTVYFVVIPSAGGTTCTIEMSDLEPSWVDAKQGFYASASSVSRVIGGCYIGTSQVYYRKWLYEETAFSNLKRYGDGIIEALSAVTITGALSVASIIASGTINTTGGIAAGTGGTLLKTKIIAIGEWNMDATGSVVLNHGLEADHICSIEGMIQNDAGNGYYPIPFFGTTWTGSATCVLAVSAVDATSIAISRSTGGFFDTIAFDGTASTVLSRGDLYIVYKV